LSYKFNKTHQDKDIADIQRQTEDNFATKDDIDDKQKKVKDVTPSIPKLTDLVDGEKKIYDDGTNQWKYERYGARLFKTQITEA